MTDPAPLHQEKQESSPLRDLPHNIDVEQALLGAMLRKSEMLDVASDAGLEPHHFYAPEHTALYEAMARLHGAGRATTIAALRPVMEDDEALKELGVDYLFQLDASLVSIINTADYAKTTIDLWRRREMILRMQEAVDLLHDRSDLDTTAIEIGNEITDHLVAVNAEHGDRAAVVTLGQAVREQMEAYERAAQDPDGAIGLLTGLTDFDRILDGFEDGRLYVIGARPAMGKTVIGQALATRLATPDGWVIIFNLEMSRGQLAGRALASESKMDVRPARRGRMSPEDWDRMAQAAERLDSANVLLDARETQTVASIERTVRQQSRKRPLRAIVIDYLQLLTASAHARRYGNRVNEISEMTWGLKTLAKRWNIPVILLSQLSRQVENREDKRPHLSDLRECLPVDEWVDTPSGPVQIGTRPQSIVSVTDAGACVRRCDYIPKRYNKTLRIKTDFGSFSVTARHLVLTGVGWKKARDLVPGRDVIACPRRIPHEERGPQPHARLLGWLIGNGHLSGTPSLCYREELDEAVNAAVGAMGVKVQRRSVQRSPGIIEAYLSNGVETGCLPNPVMTWLRDLGLEGVTASDKHIPARYLGTDTKTHIGLLRGLWETDGCVTQGAAKYATASEVLARQVKWLLHTIGARSTMRFERNDGAGLWTVRVAAADNVAMQAVCGDRRRFGPLSKASDRFLDPAPAIFVELLRELYDGPERFQQRQDGGAKLLSKGRMEAILDECSVSTIEQSPYMTMGGMGWTPVQAVERDEREVRVCDLSVPGANCFLTNGLVVHNSGSIEQDADSVIFLYREQYYLEQEPPQQRPKETAAQFSEREIEYEAAMHRCRNVIETIIAKNRDAPVGTAKLFCHLPTMTVDNLADQPDSQGGLL